MTEDELPTLHDVYSSVIQSAFEKASYILYSFFGAIWHLVMIWLPLLPGTKFSGCKHLTAALNAKIIQCIWFSSSIVLSDGASSNLTLLKMLCGYFEAVLPVNDAAEDLRARYFVDMSFTNPEDSSGNPVFAMICPSHQVLIMCCFW